MSPWIYPQPPISAATLCDAASRLRDPSAVIERRIEGLVALRDSDVVLGPAYTIRVRRARNQSDEHRRKFLEAIDRAPPGCVLVVEVATDIGGAVMGNLIATRLKSIGVAGVLADGPVRDRADLKQVAPPMLFRSATVAGLNSRQVVVETGTDVCVSGVVVHPGDWISADVDGALVIPPEELEASLKSAQELVQAEQNITRALADGKTLIEALAEAAH